MPRSIWSGAISFGLVSSLNQADPRAETVAPVSPY